MSGATLLRLAFAGTRTDTARVVLTALATALAMLAALAAATVLAIRPDPRFADRFGERPGYAFQYTHNLLVEPGLRPGVALALVLLCIPVLALAGQTARLGAPARDRRLAQLRLTGATPRQVAAIVVTETGLAAAAGTVLGLAVYAVGRVLLHRPAPDGRLPLPTDTVPPAGTLAVVALGLPALAALFATLLLRRVTFTPFGVVGRERTRPPGVWPGVAIVAGVAAFAAVEPLGRAYAARDQVMPEWMFLAMLGGGGLVALVGVVGGTTWISYATGRLLHRVARGPATLVAARRLIADPWSGSRVLAAVLAGVVFGAGAAAVRAWFTAGFEAEDEANRLSAEAQGFEHVPIDRSFYFSSLDLVDAAVTVGLAVAAFGLLVHLVDGLVSRRRAYAAMVATGVPRRVLARVVGLQTLVPVAPAVLLALAVGVALPRSLAREERRGGETVYTCTVDDWRLCEDIDSPFMQATDIPEVVRAVPVPYAELAQLGGVALVAVAVTVAIGLLFLRASTDVTELRTQ